MHQITLQDFSSGFASLEIWLEMSKALLTPTIAVVGTIIALQQWRINRIGLRHDLFDRRLGVLSAAIKAAQIAGMGTVNSDVYKDYVVGIGYSHVLGFSDTVIKWDL